MGKATEKWTFEQYKEMKKQVTVRISGERIFQADKPKQRP